MLIVQSTGELIAIEAAGLYMIGIEDTLEVAWTSGGTAPAELVSGVRVLPQREVADEVTGVLHDTSSSSSRYLKLVLHI